MRCWPNAKQFYHPAVFVCSVILVACQEHRFDAQYDRWISQNKVDNQAEHVYFDEINTISGDQHGKQIKIRGRLTYEYDEAAVYPLTDYTGYKPIWIHIEASDLQLHQFLLQKDKALITLTGELDTAEGFDRFEYSAAIKNIQIAEITQILKTQ